MNKLIKPIATVGALIIICTLLFGGRSAEKTASKFMKSLMEADAKEAYSLMSDELKESLPYETKKVAIHSMQENFDDAIEGYKDIYGKRWKYKVHVIDVYECEAISDEYEGRKMMKAEIEVTHKGSGLLNKKEGSDSDTLYLVKDGRNWYVADF
ncbi:MAG: hypothetical protein IJB75_03205 [Oscillospiraceae bacterium]|nr:hypothetical protein [Oscillospiraceae bacterium]